MNSLTRDLQETYFYLNAKRAVENQGGILTGANPTAYNTTDPLRLFIIQLVIIVLTSQLLGLVLRRIKQPKVIAEVIGGIILGPTVMGRIPGFSQHIFPTASLPFLSLVANLGLVLFLFLVGLEIDTTSIRRNSRTSITIALSAMLLPFSIGSGMSKPIYDRFVDHAIGYSHFLLFIAVSYSITAFPVLCRILTELKLLDTTVGVCVLSAGVGNDIVGWTLLALTVALVNASSGLTALWIILCAFGWILFLLFPIRITLAWFSRRSGSFENGPSMLFMTSIMLLVFASAFFTDIIGIHAIFGGFLAGLVVPREGGLTIALTEKLEDMVGIIFLPLYFTLSGLSTNLGLLNTGTIWGFVFAIIFTDWGGKFVGASIGARISGLKPREAATVGTFMSCKGLVELVVLNIGRQAGILSTQLFSMFVLDALVLTFCTTPVAVMLYPPHLRQHIKAYPRNKLSPETGSIESAGPDASAGARNNITTAKTKSRFTVVLDRMEHLPGMMSALQLLSPEEASALTSTSQARTSRISVQALRLVELTEKASLVMKSSAIEELSATDHLLRVLKTFGELNGVAVQTQLSIVSANNFGDTVEEHATESRSQMVLLAWAPVSRHPSAQSAESPLANIITNPFESLFKSSVSQDNVASSLAQSQFIRGILNKSPVDVGLFLDRSAQAESDSYYGHRKIFLPFLGGPDDRCALELVTQLCSMRNIRAVVVRFVITEHTEETRDQMEKEQAIVTELPSFFNGLSLSSMAAYPDTVYGNVSTTTKLQNKVADDVVWEQHSSRTANLAKRVQFETVETSLPLRAILARATAESGKAGPGGSLPGRLLVVLGRSRRLAVHSFHNELKSLLEKKGASGTGGELRKTTGDTATAMIISGTPGDILLVQSSKLSSE